MTNITYETIGSSLVEAIPELIPSYNEEIEWWGDEKPGAHILIGDLLTPYIISQLESLEDTDHVLKRIFNFLEQLSNHSDIRVQELVAVSVCERLCDKAEWLVKSRTYMGKTTLKLCDEVQAFRGPKE